MLAVVLPNNATDAVTRIAAMTRTIINSIMEAPFCEVVQFRFINLQLASDQH